MNHIFFCVMYSITHKPENHHFLSDSGSDPILTVEEEQKRPLVHTYTNWPGNLVHVDVIFPGKQSSIKPEYWSGSL